MVLLFLHIPKAAGSTLHRIIERQYPRRQVFTVHGRQSVASREQLRALPESKRRQIAVVKGHMAFGWHTDLEAPAHYVTLLREPVARIISHYYHVRATPTHYLHELVISQEMTLEKYVRSGICQEVNNGQTRLLSGVEPHFQEPFPPSAIDYGSNPRELLESALSNLRQHFLVVGLTEQFDHALWLLRQKMGWQYVYYRKHNVSPSRPPVSQVDADTLQVIRDLNLLDFELYQWAKELTGSAIDQAGPQFLRQVAEFQQHNARFQQMLAPFARLTSLSPRLRHLERLAGQLVLRAGLLP